MAAKLIGLAILLLAGWVDSEPITASAARPPNVRSIGDDWKPVRDSTKHHSHSRLPPPTSAYYMELGVNKKHFHLEAAPSNKVEVFAPAPPSILGSFSGFGHDTLKSRHPIKHKKPVKESFQQAESRPGYSTDLLSSPYRHTFPQSFQQPDNLGQAYFFQASLSPPPRDSGFNLVPPPSKGLAPNSYYLQFDQQTRAKPTTSSFSPYLRQHLPSYGASDYYKVPSPSSSDPYRFYTPEPPNKIQYPSRHTNGQSRPPGIDYFGNNPFGDIHLNTHKPEVKPAKDIFEQLSPLGRPFQSTTVDPPRYNSQSNDYSSLSPIEFYSTSGNVIRQTTPKPFRPSPLISDEFPLTERPSVFVTPETSSPPRKIYPIPVTTLDIPSRNENFKNPIVSTYQSVSNTQQFYDEATSKPVTTTYYKSPDVEINNNGENYFQSTPFLPTPATDPFMSEVGPTDLATPSPETNEVHKPPRTRTSRPRYRKKKPIKKPETEGFGDITTENKFQQPLIEINAEHEIPKVTTYDTIHNNYETERDQEIEKGKLEKNLKRRRPSNPNHYYSSSTYTNTESNFQESPTAFNAVPEEEQNERIPSKQINYYGSSTFSNTESDAQEIPTSFSGLAENDQKRRRPSKPNSFYSSSTFTNTEADVQENPTAYSTLAQEEEIKTTLPSTSTTEFVDNQYKRKKKPTHRIRGPSRHSSSRSTTTTTTESPQELSSEVFPHTEYRPVKETFPTENYPFSGLAFNEYGHVMINHHDESSSADYSGNTLFTTQQNHEYHTNLQEVVTTTTQEQTTTSTTTTTVAPETSTATTSKSRVRNKYNYNNTRPRFSVKNYRERLNKATSTTEAPKEEANEHRELSRTRPTRLRGNINYRHSENQEEQTETSTRRSFKPSYTGQRHAYRTTSTTQSPLLQLENPTTTERANTFKPSSQRRPSSNKYYSRYRTSTEEPTAAAEQPSTEKSPQKPKGVFSAKKRRPFPLRTRVDPTSATDDEDQLEALPENSANDLDLDHYITKKSDNIATTTLMTSSEEADWNTPSSASPETPTSDVIDHGDITKKIADLTSSPSNSFDSSGFFKGVSPSSRRTVSHITLATEDPILPIEAFFSSSLSRNNDTR